MDFFFSLTSPYARIVRIALAEKHLEQEIKARVVDPWSDDAALMKANPISRVPTLVTDDGHAIAEALLITRYLDAQFPARPLVPAAGAGTVLARAGLAFGVIDAAVQIVIGRRAVGAGFDDNMVGQRRHRAMDRGLDRLESDSPAVPGETLDLGAVTTIVAIDYLALRFPDTDWLGNRPGLAAWRAGLRDRAAVTDTMPPT